MPTSSPPRPIFVSIPQAAEMLGVGRTLMFALLKEGTVKRVKLGAKTLVLVESLYAFADRLITEQTEQTDQPED